MAAARARRAFEAWQEFASAHPPGRAFDAFRARHLADPENYSQAQAVEDYRTQPVIAEFLDNPELEEMVGGDPIARLSGDLDGPVRHAMDSAPPSNALLTLDGRWLGIAKPTDAATSTTTSTHFRPTRTPFACSTTDEVPSVMTLLKGSVSSRSLSPVL